MEDKAEMRQMFEEAAVLVVMPVMVVMVVHLTVTLAVLAREVLVAVALPATVVIINLADLGAELTSRDRALVELEEPALAAPVVQVVVALEEPMAVVAPVVVAVAVAQ